MLYVHKESKKKRVLSYTEFIFSIMCPACIVNINLNTESVPLLLKGDRNINRITEDLICTLPFLLIKCMKCELEG
jgi:hypothetical protein